MNGLLKTLRMGTRVVVGSHIWTCKHEASPIGPEKSSHWQERGKNYQIPASTFVAPFTDVDLNEIFQLSSFFPVFCSRLFKFIFAASHFTSSKGSLCWARMRDYAHAILCTKL